MDTAKRAASDRCGLVVLGLGNPIRRDDAAGLEVLRRAAGRLASEAFAAEVCWKECCAGGFDLLGEVLGFDVLVIVDAWYTEQSEPGRVRVLAPADLKATRARPTNPHLFGLPQLLGWGKRAGLDVPRLHSIVVVEVGAECMEFGEGLTKPVRAAIPAAARVLEQIIRAAIADIDRGLRQSEVSP